MFGIDLSILLITVGYIGLFAIIFAETGLFFGFFLPGDTLLFTAGILSAGGTFSVWIVIIIAIIAGIIGDSFGYYFGKRAGSYFLKKEDSWIFKKRYIEETRKFYDKHGVKTIVLARFLPIIRTFAPLLAGVSHMRYEIFMPFNIIGGVLWVVSMTLLGYGLGNIVPNIDVYVVPIIIVIFVLSFIPLIVGYIKRGKKGLSITHPEVVSKRMNDV